MEKERGSESLTDVICVSPKAAEMDRLNILKILLRAGEKAYGRQKLGGISPHFHYYICIRTLKKMPNLNPLTRNARSV